MKFEEYKDVWVYIDSFMGTPKSVGLELLTKGRELAKGLGQDLCAVVVGDKVEESIEAAKNYGADKIYVIEGKEYENYLSDTHGSAILKLVNKYKPDTFLIGATANGRELGSMLAVSLRTGLTADCTALSVDEETRNVVWERPAFGGNLYARILCEDSRPQMGTCRPGAFKKEKNPNPNAQIIREDIKTDSSDIRTKILEIVKDLDDKEINLSQADIVVSVGRGIKNKENIALVRELAQVLNAALACSRAVVDASWLPQSRQVGQTGTTVSPKIYFAIGISGAVQHLAGMSESKTIIAINTDENAPIFEVAHYCLVGDLFDIVPELIKEFKLKKV